MFQKLIRKFRGSSQNSSPAAHSLPLNFSAYDYDAEPLKDDASFVTTFSDGKQPTLVEMPHRPLQAEMLEEDNMAWVRTKSRKVQPTPPYVRPTSYYVQPEYQHVERAETLEEENLAWVSTKRRKAKPAPRHAERAEMLEEDNMAWTLPLGRKMKPASRYVQRAEMLEEDNMAW